MVRGNEANVRKGIDAEESETGLRFFEFNVAEEQFPMRWGRRVWVVGDVRGGDECEFVAKLFEAKLRLFVELNGVEEDDNPIGSWGFD